MSLAFNGCLSQVVGPKLGAALRPGEASLRLVAGASAALAPVAATAPGPAARRIGLGPASVTVATEGAATVVRIFPARAPAAAMDALGATPPLAPSATAAAASPPALAAAAAAGEDVVTARTPIPAAGPQQRSLRLNCFVKCLRLSLVVHGADRSAGGGAEPRSGHDGGAASGPAGRGRVATGFGLPPGCCPREVTDFGLHCGHLSPRARGLLPARAQMAQRTLAKKLATLLQGPLPTRWGRLLQSAALSAIAHPKTEKKLMPFPLIWAA